MQNNQKPSFPLRLPDSTKEHLQAAAQKIGRSMNAEIVARLQESMPGGTGMMVSMEWTDLVALLHQEAAKRGTPIAIVIAPPPR